MTKPIQTSIILAFGLLAAAGCSWQSVCPDFINLSPAHGLDYSKCPQGNVQSASTDKAARLAALEAERQRLADELAAARRQNGTLSSRVSDLERQLADRDREIAALRSGASDSAKLASQLAAANSDKDRLAAQLAAAQGNEAEKQKLAAELAAARQRIADLERQLTDANQAKGSLAKAEKDLLKALQPEIKSGNVSVHQSGDQLIINLASSMLFDSGQAQLKSSGADALKRVGTVLTDFPEKSVHVAGYTDNVAIKGPLQKKFPSNKELSDARAESAAQALRDGGVSSNLSAAGHGDSNPVANNNTAAGRAKNRRVEVIVK